MKFSIVIPTYNRAYILWRTIQSVQAQNFVDWELIIVDDGSTDDTKKLMAQFVDDVRIRYVWQENAWASAARNTGLSAARGEVVIYLDSDDVFHPNALSVLAREIDTHPNAKYGICNHNRIIRMVDKDGLLVVAQKLDDTGQQGKATLQDFYDWKVKTTSSGLFHRRSEFLGKTHWRNVLIEDLDFLLQMGALQPEGFLHVSATLLTYTQTYGADGLCSGASYGDFAKAFGQIYEWHKDDPLMKNPDVYRSRVGKYTALQERVEKGLEPAPQYKYFPELVGRKT